MPAATGHPENTACFPSCMEQKPPTSGDTIHSCTRAWHRPTALEEGQKQDLCPEKTLGPRTVPVPEVCLFCLLLHTQSQLPRRQEDRTIADIYIPLSHHKIHEVKPCKTEGRNRQFYNNGWRCQYPTLNNSKNNQTEDKEIEDFNNTINQLALTDIYRTLHSTTIYLFSPVHAGHFLR